VKDEEIDIWEEEDKSVDEVVTKCQDVQKYIHHRSPQLGQFLKEKILEPIDILEFILKEECLDDSKIMMFLR